MPYVAPRDRFSNCFPLVKKGGSYIGTAEVCVLGVSSRPFLQKASIMHLLGNCQPLHKEVAQKLKHSFYTGNCGFGVFNTDEPDRFIKHAKLIMLKVCFNLRGFESNAAGKTA
ncbi:hypothetical protein TNCT_453881 [Trichonephila clavata]|uniref:Uncharacterized protein n=1 Tax=Trichonephila clavata TaxID=2740835 RepID=A0A8X6GKK1_TRICU|nr:hypothetical protein TNCT_453881 [Trichonephila clavata]